MPLDYQDFEFNILATNNMPLKWSYDICIYIYTIYLDPSKAIVTTQKILASLEILIREDLS